LKSSAPSGSIPGMRIVYLTLLLIVLLNLGNPCGPGPQRHADTWSGPAGAPATAHPAT